MKRITKRILSAGGILLLLVLFFAGSAGGAFASDQPRTDADSEEISAGYITDSFDVDAQVQKDNSYLITEKISVDFLEPSHGVFRSIPVAGRVVSEYNGQQVTMDARMRIEDISVGGAPFTQSQQGNDIVLQIGDPNRQITGPMTYTITYLARLYDNGIPDYDMIYYNVLPDSWASPIRSSHIQITIPGADTDVSAAELIAGASGGTSTTTYFDTNVQKDTQADTIVFTAQSKGALPQGVGATFLLRVPKGFFQNQLTDAGLIMGVRIVFIAAPLLCLLLWILFGRDKKPVETVEFYPPDGLPSGEVGYLVDGKVQSRDMLSMILWWASQGFLKIEETSEGQFTVFKTGALPAGVKSYQTTFWNALFAQGDRVDLGTPNTTLSMALDQSKRQLVSGYKQDMHTNLYTKASIRATVACSLLAVAPLIAFIVYTMLAGAPTTFGGGVNTQAIADAVGRMGSFEGFVILMVVITIVRSVARVGGGGSTVGRSFGYLWFLLPFVIMVVLGVIGSVSINLPEMLMAMASIAVCIFFAVIARQRTDFYETILGRIYGFRNFIKVAEVDRMQKLFADDPQYYYKTLPYAWVFGLSDIWAKKFERMITAPPDWYSGYYGANMFTTMLLVSSLSRLHTASLQSFRPPVQTGGGGGGWGGGGFSGGGGFVGGGFGGGGGGRW